METPTRTDDRMTAATGEARTTLGALDTLEAEVEVAKGDVAIEEGEEGEGVEVNGVVVQEEEDEEVLRERFAGVIEEVDEGVKEKV